MKVFSITRDGKLVPYAEHDFKEENLEEQLEAWLEGNPSCILENEDVLLIGRQVATNLGSVIDLLGIDEEGNLVVIELKRDRTPRETLAQILEYASFVEDLSYDQLQQILEEYTTEEGLVLADYHRNYFGLREDEAVAFNKNQNLLIVGQVITREVRQTSSFLRKKGVDVHCLEFKYFVTESGEQIISTDFVVGGRTEMPTRISSGSLPKTTEEKFLASLDQNGKDIFEPLLDFAKQSHLPIHWGSKGFSLNVDLDGTHVCLLYGYPPDSVFKQSIYSASAEIPKKVENAEHIVEGYKTQLARLGLFEPTKKDMKWIIKTRVEPETRAQLLGILSSVVEQTRDHWQRE